MEERKGHWWQTFSGVMFWPLDPRPEEVKVVDIAHHLSLLCRFNGAVRTFYSVAQHSVLVSRHLQKHEGDEAARWGLLHDASEAYVGDMVRPLKLSLAEYRAAERRVQEVIAERFGLPWPMPSAVRAADDVFLMMERRDLMGPPPHPWVPALEGLELPEEEVIPWAPLTAEGVFLQTFRDLFPRGAR